MATTPGVFQNVMDIFRGSPTDPQVANNPQNPNQPNTPPNGVVPPNVDPNALTPQPKPGEDPNKKTSPLDAFSKLWEAPVVDPNKPQNTGLDFQNVDPKKMMEAAQKVDFGQILGAEQQAAIAKGGEEGMKATIAAMNAVAQLTYAQSSMAATKIIGAAVEQARTDFAKSVPDLVRAAALNNSLVKANPVFQNPAVVPIVEGLKSQMLIKFPDATPDQLTEMAQRYFLEVSQSFAPAPNTTTGKPNNKVKAMTGKGDEDWGEFFGVNSPS